MAYSPTRISTVKLDVSPSLGWGNLALSHSRLCYYHKDNVYSVDCRAVDGRVAPAVEKVPLVDTPPSPVTGLAWVVLGGVSLLVVTTKAGFGLWNSEASALVAHVPLTPVDVPTEEAPFHFARGIAALPATDELAVGTSWGAILVTTVPAGGRGPLARRTVLKPGHRAAISALAADERVLVSADDEGAIWLTTLADPEGPAVPVFAACGTPVTCLGLRDGVAVAGYSDGHVRVFRIPSPSGAPFLEAEIAAHARAVSALDWHPTNPTFVTTGLDAAVHVWTLPELAAGGGGGGRAKVTLDTTARIPDTWPTGVQFTRHHGARPGAAPNIAVSVYDSHLLRVFLGL